MNESGLMGMGMMVGFTVVFFIVFVLNFWGGEDPSRVTMAKQSDVDLPFFETNPAISLACFMCTITLLFLCSELIFEVTFVIIS